MRSLLAHIIPLTVITKMREIKHSIQRRSRRGSDAEVFSRIHFDNAWKSPDTLSGPGSELEETTEIRELLPDLLTRLSVRTLLDIPCGDFFWMRHVDLREVHYTGADIVAKLVEENQLAFGSEWRRFLLLDVVKSDLPRVDLVLCRDCLIHLSLQDAKAALNNIRRSGAKYLLITTDPSIQANRPISTGEYRPINLELPPFNMTRPLEIHRDRYNPHPGKELIDPQKSLALYKIN